MGGRRGRNGNPGSLGASLLNCLIGSRPLSDGQRVPRIDGWWAVENSVEDDPRELPVFFFPGLVSGTSRDPWKISIENNSKGENQQEPNIR